MRRLTLPSGDVLLLGGLVAAAAVAVVFLLQTPLADRVGPAGLAHLSVDPISADGLVWGGETRGPGEAFVRAERLMHGTTAVLLFFVAAVGGFGQIALSGVAAVGRRAEIRLRRAVGAPRNRLLGDLAREAARVFGRALVVGTSAALAAFLALQAVWMASPEIATPVLTSGGPGVVGPGIVGPAILGIGVAGGLLLAWVVFAFAVVQSAEVSPGAPLHAKTRLAEPSRGEVCHPGVPVLQIAAVCLVLTSAGTFVAGAERLRHADGPGVAPRSEGPWAEAGAGVSQAGAFIDLPRFLVVSAPGAAAPTIESLLAPNSPLRGDPGNPVSVTTPGFAEGIGHLRYAQTECGRCILPGSPPVLAPYKGELAVHHAVSPDTFPMAGIRILEGRGFTPADGPAAEAVAIVSRGFAAEHFENGEAIGRRVRIGDDRDRWHTVVGVVDPLPRKRLPARTQPPEDVFVPVAQIHPIQVEVMAARIAAGTASGTAQLPAFPVLPAEVRPVASPAERDGHIAAWTSGFVRLWRGAGFVAAVLAMIGVLVTVARRVREEAAEIAVHRAVGATRGRIVCRYLVFGLGIGGVGAGLGCWASLFVVSVIVPEGFGTSGALIPVFLGVGGSLVIAAAIVAAAAAAWEMRGNVRAGLG